MPALLKNKGILSTNFKRTRKILFIKKQDTKNRKLINIEVESRCERNLKWYFYKSVAFLFLKLLEHQSDVWNTLYKTHWQLVRKGNSLVAKKSKKMSRRFIEEQIQMATKTNAFVVMELQIKLQDFTLLKPINLAKSFKESY